MAYIARDAVIGNVSGSYAGYRNNSAKLTVDVRTDPHGEAFEIAIMAGIRYRSHQHYSMVGQIRDALDHVVSYAPGWNSEKVRRLAEIWDRWHLADTPASVIRELQEMFKGE